MPHASYRPALPQPLARVPPHLQHRQVSGQGGNAQRNPHTASDPCPSQEPLTANRGAPPSVRSFGPSARDARTQRCTHTPTQMASKDMGLVAPDRPVALFTTDFPMQNVAMHLGLHLLAADGRAIRFLKKWILRCAPGTEWVGTGGFRASEVSDGRFKAAVPTLYCCRSPRRGWGFTWTNVGPGSGSHPRPRYVHTDPVYQICSYQRLRSDSAAKLLAAQGPGSADVHESTGADICSLALGQKWLKQIRC